MDLKRAEVSIAVLGATFGLIGGINDDYTDLWTPVIYFAGAMMLFGISVIAMYLESRRPFGSRLPSPPSMEFILGGACLFLGSDVLAYVLIRGFITLSHHVF